MAVTNREKYEAIREVYAQETTTMTPAFHRALRILLDLPATDPPARTLKVGDMVRTTAGAYAVVKGLEGKNGGTIVVVYENGQESRWLIDNLAPVTAWNAR